MWLGLPEGMYPLRLETNPVAESGADVTILDIMAVSRK
jgi:hypothetical protein